MTPEEIRAMLEDMAEKNGPRCYKLVQDGYLLAVGVGPGGTEITGEEYEAIRAVIDACPTPPEGFDYRLREEDLIWQLYAVMAPEEEPLDPGEALEMICGSRSLTKTQAEGYRADVLSAKLAREERKEKREE